jgi:hypothetical protein
VSLNNVRAVADGFHWSHCTSWVCEMLGIGQREDTQSLHGHDIPLVNWGGRGFATDSGTRKISEHIQSVDEATFWKLIDVQGFCRQHF